MGVIWTNANDEISSRFINRAKREFRKMSAISIEAQQMGYVEVKFLAPNGSEAVIRYRTEK